MLPEEFNGQYELFNVLEDKKVGIFGSGRLTTITLQPFEVSVMNVGEIRD